MFATILALAVVGQSQTPLKSTPRGGEPVVVTAEPQNVKGPDFRTDGVDRSQISGNRGYTASSDRAREFLQQSIEDYNGSLHVTVIGPKEDRDKVINDLKTHPAFAAMRGRLLIQGYDPKDWAVNPSLGFQVDGKPTILVQEYRSPYDSKGGKVLYRAMDYAGGPEKLAQAIRKCDPNYDPKKDPGPANPADPPLIPTPEVSPEILMLGAVVLLLLLLPKKGPQ